MMNDFAPNGHRFLMMACRSPWPSNPGEHSGPGKIHTWYSEDHVLDSLDIA
jgi:hypothetical protein